jgi:type II secretory pathway pseudopilin PulG
VPDEVHGSLAVQVNLQISESIMNTIAKALISFAVIAAPTFAFAQSQDVPLTRAQVRAELVQLEQAGYSLASGENASYPTDIQAAEATVAAQQNVNQTNQAYGGTQSGGADSGAMQRNAWSKASANNCVGPAGFCSMYFGS